MATNLFLNSLRVAITGSYAHRQRSLRTIECAGLIPEYCRGPNFIPTTVYIHRDTYPLQTSAKRVPQTVPIDALQAALGALNLRSMWQVLSALTAEPSISGWHSSFELSAEGNARNVYRSGSNWNSWLLKERMPSPRFCVTVARS
jgi:hypothetical protein